MAAVDGGRREKRRLRREKLNEEEEREGNGWVLGAHMVVPHLGRPTFKN